MKKIILLDPNFSADPISDKLIESGYEVLRVGKFVGEKRIKDFEEFIDLDYSNVNKVLEMFKDQNAFQIIPGCTDLSFRISNQIGEFLSLPGYRPFSYIQHLLDKNKLSDFMQKENIPHPLTISKSSSSLPESLLLSDWIVKPEIGFSGRGVRKMNLSAKGASIDYINKYIYDNDLILQEFTEGQLYSFSGIVKNSRIINSTIVLEKCINNKWQVNLSFIDKMFSKNIKKEVIEISEKICRASLKTTGLLHLQFILTPNGPKVIEVIERMPGDLYSQLIEWSTNKNYVSGFLSQYVPIRRSKVNSKISAGYLARVTTSLECLERYKQGSSTNDFILLQSTRIYRHTQNDALSEEEVVAFLSFKNYGDVKNWSESKHTHSLFIDGQDFYIE